MKTFKMNSITLVALILTLSFCSCKVNGPANPPAEMQTWENVLEQDLHMLGHRNWILVVDKAFPEQSSAGMKYIYVEQDLLPTLRYVLEKIESSSHVKPIIYRDKELSFIKEEQVAGIDTFRDKSESLLEGREVNTLLHDDVFKLLDESSSLFKVLVIKTNCTLPYTSVFLQMDCAYWNSEDEQVLRNRMSVKESL
ncbi:MAG: hypothetical protein ABFS28_16230 [Bacteroidota bacterium]